LRAGEGRRLASRTARGTFRNFAMFNYKRPPAIAFFLRLLDYAIQNDTHAEVLDVLGRGIKSAAARIDRAAKSGSDDYAEGVIATETEIIEGLLGAAYVVCQTQITAIAQAALDCRAQTVKDGLAFTAFGDLMRACLETQKLEQLEARMDEIADRVARDRLHAARERTSTHEAQRLSN
jgi:hypothetical protein